MRYIPIQNLEIPDGWLEKAKLLHEKLAAAQPEERAKIIDDNPIWQELFVPLSKLSNGKCWYSEAREVMSDRDIDHFRPKNEARNHDSTPRASKEGYWWLAYEWDNYRFSSIYSNRRRTDKFSEEDKKGGKWCYFPLFEESYVAKSKARIKDEDIVLLDPCNKYDPGLLTFEGRGVAIPNAAAVMNKRDETRVKVSIELYHLDHEPLREEREKVWDRCQRYINEMRTIANSEEAASATGKARINFLKDEISKMNRKEEELSAVAIACCIENKLSFLTEPI